MSPSSNKSREVIHLSLGSPACQLSAHWLNLQGLSVTTSADVFDHFKNNHNESDRSDQRPLCDPAITHMVYRDHYVPRVLMVDHDDNDPAILLPPTEASAAEDVAVSPSVVFEHHQHSSLWSGSIERINTNSSSNSYYGTVDSQQRLRSFQESSHALAYGPYSRYRVNSGNPSLQYRYQQLNQNSDNNRHVNWDEEEEVEEEDEEDREDRLRYQNKQYEQWQQSTYQPLQSQLEEFWTTATTTTISGEVKPSTSTAGVVDKDSPPMMTEKISWRNYWMPPYHPKSILTLPSPLSFSSIDNYYCNGTSSLSGGIVQEWKESELLERLRWLLENCDSCQGAVLVSSGHGLYAGLTTALLQELSDECPAAKRLVVSVQDKKQERGEQQQQQDASWRTIQEQRIRRNVELGLTRYHYSEEAHAVLTIQNSLTTKTSSRGEPTSCFATLARTAAALECATLAYRFDGTNNSTTQSLVGLNAHYYGNWNGDFGSTSHLTMSEYMAVLQPSKKHSIIELDALLPGTEETNEYGWLREGTSVERRQYDARARQVHNVLPGAWMMDRDKEGGLLSSLSYPEENNYPMTKDRSAHHHFGLSASLRPAFDISPLPEEHRKRIPNMINCLMQGMSIRYRPQQSFAALANQSLVQLTDAGYGAGSYWKSVWTNPTKSPVLSVLGNSTRSYSHLDKTTCEMKKSISRKCHGFYNRDVQQGVLPELEDCQDALEGLFDLQDVYRPPEGSGVVVEEDCEF